MEETEELEEQYMDWTDMSKFCPATKNWLENDFGFNSFTRVRFMLIEPGGYIKPHSDTDHSELIAINIALNMPKKCYFIQVRSMYGKQSNERRGVKSTGKRFSKMLCRTNKNREADRIYRVCCQWYEGRIEACSKTNIKDTARYYRPGRSKIEV